MISKFPATANIEAKVPGGDENSDSTFEKDLILEELH